MPGESLRIITADTTKWYAYNFAPEGQKQKLCGKNIVGISFAGDSDEIINAASDAGLDIAYIGRADKGDETWAVWQR